jgi:hypothetical protein
MGKNVFNVRRTAFVNITLPTSNSTTVSTGSGIYIPKGAIITGVKIMPGDAVSLSQLSNLTFNLYVGGQVIGSNDNVVSAKMVETVAGQFNLVATAGIRVATGGNVILHLGSGSSVTGGIIADADIYVDYLYCDARDDK